MFRVAGRVIYADGRAVEYEATQRELAAWERFALRQGLPVGYSDDPTAPRALATMTRYLGWAALMRGDEDPVSFEVWDAMVSEVTSDEAELPEGSTAADPTQRDRSDDY